MAIYRNDIIDIEMGTGNIHRSFLNHSIGEGDNLANRFGVRLYRNGEPVNVEGATCQGIFMAPDGQNILVSGTDSNNQPISGTSGNMAWVQLPQACYNVEGQFSLAIKVVKENITATMRIVDGVVSNTGAEHIVIPVDTLPTTQEIIDAYEEWLAVSSGSVRYDITQELTNAEKAKARSNIGAVSQQDFQEGLQKQNNTISEAIGYYDFPIKYLKAPDSYTIGSADVTGQVYFNDDQLHITKVKKIRFLAKQGTTEFYIVTYNRDSDTCSASLLETVTNTASEDGKTKEISVFADLADNQYIGISGMMCFVNNETGHNNTVYRISDNYVYHNANQLVLYTCENEQTELDGVNVAYDLKTIVTGGKDHIKIEECVPYGSVNTESIYVQDIPFPVSRFNRIQFRAVTGTMDVYKIEYIDGIDILKYTKIASYTTASADNGSIRTEKLCGYLEPGQYIGVSGDFAWKNNVPGCWEWTFTTTGLQKEARQHQTPLFKVYMDETVSDDYDFITEINSDVRGGKELVELDKYSYGTINIPNITVNNGMKYPVGKINRIQYIATQGTCSFYKIEEIDEIGEKVLRYSLIGTYTNLAAEEGLIKTIQVDVDIERGQYIGVVGNIAFTNDAPKNYYTWSFSTDGERALSGLSFGQLILFKVFYDGADLEKKEDKRLRKYGEVTLYNKPLTASNTDLVGTLTDGSYGLSVSSLVRLNKFYASADREVLYQCKFSSDCVAYFNTLQFSDYAVQSTIVVDVANKQFGVSTYPLVSCPILNSSDEFTVSIYLHYDYIYITVTDLNNGKSVTTENYNSFVGGGGIGAVCMENNHTLPRFTDFYGFEKHSGTSFQIKKMVVTCAKCDLLICGDSITEAYPYWPVFMYPNHWAQKIIEKSNGRAMVSARGGGTIVQLREWLENELPFIKPKYCMITIGANGSNTVARLEELMQFIKAQGTIPILNHIPCYDKNGVTDFSSVNAEIDTVRASEEVIGADLEIPTSVGRAGTEVLTSTMWLDEYPDSSIIYIHPNEYGSLLMFNQILIDTPEIFS